MLGTCDQNSPPCLDSNHNANQNHDLLADSCERAYPGATKNQNYTKFAKLHQICKFLVTNIKEKRNVESCKIGAY